MTERRVIAAFDFDGTLIRGDSLLPFLTHLCGPSAVALSLARATPLLSRGFVDPRARNAAKELVVRRLLAGRLESDVLAAGEMYARELTARVRPSMTDRIRWHTDRGHALVMVSASLDVYLRHVGRALGFAAVLATGLTVDARGRLTGELSNGNVRGEVKARLLRQWLGAEPFELYAYGDSSGDHELLAMATYASKVKRGKIGLAPDGGASS